MEKLSVHFPLPLREIPDQRSSTGADLSLFGTFCHKKGIVGNNVIEMLEILSILCRRINYSSYHHASFVAKQISITLLPTTPFLWHRKYKQNRKIYVLTSHIQKQLPFLWHGGK